MTKLKTLIPSSWHVALIPEFHATMSLQGVTSMCSAIVLQCRSLSLTSVCSELTRLVSFRFLKSSLQQEEMAMKVVLLLVILVEYKLVNMCTDLMYPGHYVTTSF